MIQKFHEKELDEIYVNGSNQEVFAGKLLHVQLDHVTLPSGNDATREYIRHPGAVAIVPVLDDGRIILVKQCRYPLGTVMWEIPAGKLDHGPEEEILECAKRELSEETGYTARKWDFLISIATTPGFSDEIIHIFKAEGLRSGEQHPDDDEFISARAFSPEEIKNMIKNGELYDSKTICALYASGI